MSYDEEIKRKRKMTKMFDLQGKSMVKNVCVKLSKKNDIEL
jgi:hypothetical protein